EARFAVGLATRTEELLARQERVRAEYDLQLARRAVSDARAALAESVGISPALPLEIVDLSGLPLPADLPETVERTIDRALAQRPDLAARLAELRASEAELRRARADRLPRVSLAGAAGGAIGSFETERSGSRGFDYAEPIYGAFLTVSWTLFD